MTNGVTNSTGLGGPPDGGPPDERYTWGDFRLDVGAWRLERDGQPVALEPKALDLLVLLVRRRGRLVSKAEIFDEVWRGTAVSDHALTRVVAQLRRALGDEARDGRCIETVPTRGYRWIGDVIVETPARGTASPAPLDPVAPRPAFVLPRGAARGLTAAAVVIAIAGAVLLSIGWPVRGPAGNAGGPWNTSPFTVASAAFPRQVTSSRGLDLHPSFGPDGSLAFSSDRTGAFEIHVRGVPGDSVDVALTSDGNQNVQPAWSPDGRYIAYHSVKRGGIWIVPSRGGSPRQIVETGSRPAWSPDGTRIAFNTDEHADLIPFGFMSQSGSTIRMVNADGSSPRDVTALGEPDGWHGGPVWSPDGRRISFTSIRGGYQYDQGIWTMDLESGRLIATQRGGFMYELAYATDGATLYAAGGEGLLWRIKVDPATGEPGGWREAIAVPGVQSVRGLSVGRDGRIAFAGMMLDSQIWALPLTPQGTAAGPPRALTNDNLLRNSVPALSPDGMRVAYMSRRHGEAPHIWTVGVDGSGATQLTSRDAIDAQPRWLADSRRVAYFSIRDGRPGLWSVDLETRRESPLADVTALFLSENGMDGSKGEIAISPDARMLIFSLIARPHAVRRLYAATVGGGEPRLLTPDRRDIGYPVLSRDGRLVAVEIKDGASTHLGVVPIDGGEVVQLTRERGQSWVRSWSADGSRVVFAAQRDGVWSLRAVSTKDRTETVILPAAPAAAYVRYPEWSSKNDTVVYEQGQSWGNIFTLRP